MTPVLRLLVRRCLRRTGFWGLLLTAQVSAAGPDVPAPPPGLACLAKWYGVKVQPKDSGWQVVLPDGTTFPWDDGRVKSFDDRLEHPDLEDTLALPYRAGAIQPVTSPEEDPGRIRFDPLFRAVYGQSPNTVALVDLRFLGKVQRVHRKVKPAFERVEARLRTLLAQRPALSVYLEGIGGTFQWRAIAGTKRLSAHAFGVSMDLNVRRSHYWRWQRPPAPLKWRNQIPEEIVQAFEAEGFIWGGRWYHYDTMHFEYRPELLDPTCRG